LANQSGIAVQIQLGILLLLVEFIALSILLLPVEVEEQVATAEVVVGQVALELMFRVHRLVAVLTQNLYYL